MQEPERARAYSRLKDRLSLAGTGLDLAGSAAFIATGLAARLNARLLPNARPSLRQRLRYDAAVSLLSWAAGLPLGCYSGYVIEQRFGLSNQPPAGWALDTLKAKAISAPLEVALLEGVYYAIGRAPRRWWLVCAGAALPLTAVLAQLFPVLILPRFNRYEPLRDAELAARLRALTARAGVPVADVLQMDMSRRTSKANAFFAGLGPSKRIVLADTLLEQFTPEEIEGIVAHEAGHQAHRDIWRGVALSGAFTLATAKVADTLARRLLRVRPRWFGTAELADRRSLPALGLALSVAGVALLPVQLAYSRALERRADRYAIELTGDARAYAAAMRRLAATNLADPEPPRPVVWLLHSHPPIAERVRAAEAAAG